MAKSYSPNSLLQIKPNRFLRARFRNIRWMEGMTINVDSTPPGVNDSQVIPYDPDAVPEPTISTQNEDLARIKDRYNS